MVTNKHVSETPSVTLTVKYGPEVPAYLDWKQDSSHPGRWGAALSSLLDHGRRLVQNAANGEGSRRGGRNGKREKIPDVLDFIRDHLRVEPSLSPRELWDRIPNSWEEYKRIFRDGEIISAEPTPPRNTVWKLKFDAFRRYVYQVKRELR